MVQDIRKYVMEYAGSQSNSRGSYPNTYRGRHPASPMTFDYTRSFDDQKSNQNAGGLTPWKEKGTKEKVLGKKKAKRKFSRNNLSTINMIPGNQ